MLVKTSHEITPEGEESARPVELVLTNEELTGWVRRAIRASRSAFGEYDRTPAGEDRETHSKLMARMRRANQYLKITRKIAAEKFRIGGDMVPDVDDTIMHGLDVLAEREAGPWPIGREERKAQALGELMSEIVYVPAYSEEVDKNRATQVNFIIQE